MADGLVLMTISGLDLGSLLWLPLLAFVLLASRGTLVNLEKMKQKNMKNKRKSLP